MAITTETIWVCEDCQAVIHGDPSCFDYWYSPEEAERRLAETTKAVDSFSPAYLCAGDGYDEFSRSQCECCGSVEAGTRHEAIVITNEE